MRLRFTHRLVAFIAAIGTLSLPAGRILANEVGASGNASGFVIHDAEQTLRQFCSRDAEGHLWFQLPGGSRFELVTSTDDPIIANPGDGSFHPFDPAEVQAALNEVRFPLAAINADVFILPYPRRAGLESAAGRELVLLSPGVRPLGRAQQHAEVVHELGHVVQYALMPDGRTESWSGYRRLRGIDDSEVYSPTSRHADRPHEIFAEDFRALFGGPPAVQSGTIENPRLTPPEHVAGLDRFMLGLAGVRTPARDLTASRNPARGAMSFSRVGETASPLELFDVTGRLVTTLEAVVLPGSIEWRWNGRDRGGLPLTGAVFARVQGGRGAALKVMVLPSR